MKFLKRAAAALLSLSMLVSAAGCGEDTANAMTVDGTDVRAGLYIYYAVNAYQDAMEILQDGGQDFSEVTDSKEIGKALKESDIDGVTAKEWIQNKAAAYCADYVAVEREFETQGLSLTGSDLAQIDASVESSMSYFGDFFKGAGIGEQTVKDITTNTFKQQKLWEKYYGEDGLKGIEDETLYDYYKDNHLRVKFISMPLKDGEGNLLKADGKAEIKAMADDYLARLDKKKGDAAALLNEMDFLIEEHNNYVTSLSEAAVTTTDDEGNTITTPTTAKLTTDKNGSTGTTTAEPDAESTETTTTAAETTGETTETTTTVEGDTTDTTDTTAEVTTEATTTTTTTTEVVTNTANERVLTVSTSAKEDEQKADETTAAPTYTPCEEAYNWLADPETPLLEPKFFEDESGENYYIVMKMDITERMTDSDLWTDSQIESVRNDLYYEEFQDLMEEWGGKLNIVRNEKAFARYKVLDLDILAYQNALMQRYYSMYNMNY